jgi:photosystem II stability/assembly factor-like uncharacterized protein
MKKYTSVLAVFSLFLSQSLFAQDWIRMMNDPSVNVHDVQAAFYKWQAEQKDSGKVEGGIKGITEEQEPNVELFKRWEWYMEPRTYPTGVRPDKAITAKNYNAYLDQKASERKDDRMLKPANWTYAGNTKVPGGGGDGRVNHLRFYPGNDSIMYACSPAGGLWKTTNMGGSWSVNTDQLADLATSDVAINPLNPKIMYLATGDGDGTDETTIGILKSYDGGKTWDTTGMSYTLQTSGPAYTTVNQLLINPNDTNIVLAATSFGFYMSTNSGYTWKNTLNQNIKSIEFEPMHPATVYAATYYGEFFRSVDSGHTFTRVITGLPSPALVGRLQIAVTPADSNVVYLLAEAPSTSSFYGLYMSIDRGQTFTTQCAVDSGAPNLLGYSASGSDNTGQGWYTLSLAVSPTNTDTLIVGGVNIWMSTDKGVTWKLNAYWTGLYAPYVHADIHELVYLPGSGHQFFAACDGGVFTTTTQGKVWNDISNNLEIGEQYSIGLSSLTLGLSLSGWQDNGTNKSGTLWNQVIGGDGMVCFIDNTTDGTMYGSYQYGALENSFDGGYTWNSCTSGITESGPWTTRWIQDPNYYTVLYAGFKNVWLSGDQGNSWGQVSTWGTGSITAMAIAPSSNSNVMYASQSGAIYKTTDGCITWTNITHTLPVGAASITGIAVSPTDQNRLWVTFSGWTGVDKVFESKDGGATWVNISAGLPNLPVNCIAYQPGSPDGIYIGTEIGVYYMDTVLGSWIDFSNGLPNVMIDDIKVYGPTSTVYVASYGRGTWQSNGYLTTGVSTVNLNSTVKVYPNPTNGLVRIEFDMPQSGDYNVDITNVLGQQMSSTVLHINGGYTDNVDMSSYSKGVYFFTISKGSNRIVKKVVLY